MTVRSLFRSLHEFNAGLDPLFALADGWASVLDQYLARNRETGEGITLVAWQNDTPVGLIMMQARLDSRIFQHRRWLELWALYVVPEARGRGVADRLLSAGLAWGQAHGYHRVQLYVTATNQQAKRFYAHRGFEEVQEIWRRTL
ncbi:MAG: GNAT family N-acetyltransferase [Chloroflexota bacterium]